MNQRAVQLVAALMAARGQPQRQVPLHSGGMHPADAPPVPTPVPPDQPTPLPTSMIPGYVGGDWEGEGSYQPPALPWWWKLIYGSRPVLPKNPPTSRAKSGLFGTGPSDGY